MRNRSVLHSAIRRDVFAGLLCAALLLAAAWGCERKPREPAIGEAYVSSGSVNIRDRLGAWQTTVTTVKAGERLDILRRRRRWLWVRTASGAEGWLEERHVVTREVYDIFQKLRRDVAAKPSLGEAHARRDQNLHLEPSRKSPRYYQVKENEKCEALERRVAERPPPAGAAAETPPSPPGAGPPPSSPGSMPRPQPPPEKKFEDWYLVRCKDKAGWGLAQALDMSVPDDVLQYAEGKRVVAWFVLNEVEAANGEKKPQILWATSAREGTPHDFDGFRVFLWSRRRRHYETAYIERNLKGFFPIRVEVERTPQGEFPAFSVTTENREGQKVTRKFLLREQSVRRSPVL